MSESLEPFARFAKPPIVKIEHGRGGFPKIVVASQLCHGEVYLHGAHITHFQPRGAEPILFLSEFSQFEAGRAIRGGIPVIFPWFGPKTGDPAAPMHGIARLNRWDIESVDVQKDASVRVVLSWASNETTRRDWPHDFALRLVINFAAALDVTMEARNTSGEAYQFEHALHTYLQVGDVRQASVEGLGGASYTDRLDPVKPQIQKDAAIHFTGETDRLYQPTTGTCIVRDPSMTRSIAIEKQNSSATVVWNPWIDKAKAMSDFGDDEWPRMLCVETANCRDTRVSLSAGATHRMRAIIRLV